MTVLPTVSRLLRDPANSELAQITDAFGRWDAARRRLGDHRRARTGDRGPQTWSHTDTTPPAETAAVWDLDGDVWVLTGPTWRMRDWRQDEYEGRAGDRLVWAELAAEYGPLTQTTPDAAKLPADAVGGLR